MCASEDRENQPFVSIYISREQAKEVRRVVLWHAEGHPESHPLWAALKRIDEAIEENR